MFEEDLAVRTSLWGFAPEGLAADLLRGIGEKNMLCVPRAATAGKSIVSLHASRREQGVAC